MKTLPDRLLGWALALGFVLLWYWVLQGLGAWLFDVYPSRRAVPRDLLLHLLLGAGLYAISRNLRWFIPAYALLTALFHLSNAAKLAILGSPVMPDDFLAVLNLFLLLHGWQWWLLVLILALPLGFLLWMPLWHRRRTWVFLASAALMTMAVALAPTPLVQAMDSRLGNSVWNQRANYQQRGLPLHLLQETARYLSRLGSPPSVAEVESALDLLAAHSRPVVPEPQRQGRNLHLILLESFWDPMALTAAGLSEDPLDPRFRALWQATGESKVMSPVFGGYTANAEFEALCGFPVTEDAVFFEGWLRRDVPCLPRHLAQQGYWTIASHPNVAGFWNRVNAYRRLGFETYWADKDFVKDDMNREFLSDSSLYRQVMERTRPHLQGERPLFNYILTFFGHLDYPLNAQRPKRIQVARESGLIEGYVNQMYYKSRELMDFLELLQQEDPDALVVLFGDHLPFLGPNFAGYTESGLLAASRSQFDADMVHRLVTTPLVILDGRKGPVPLGEVPMYQLPGLILRLLGDGENSLVRLLDREEGPVIRPLPGMHLRLDQDERLLCRHEGPSETDCEASQAWLQAAMTLTHDLFGGRQHGLGKSWSTIGQ